MYAKLSASSLSYNQKRRDEVKMDNEVGKTEKERWRSAP
jgi:hypothetical protein